MNDPARGLGVEALREVVGHRAVLAEWAELRLHGFLAGAQPIFSRSGITTMNLAALGKRSEHTRTRTPNSKPLQILFCNNQAEETFFQPSSLPRENATI